MPLNSHVLRLFQEKINLDFYFFFLLIESFFFLASKTIVAISFCLFSFILFFFSLILKNFPSIKISMLFIHPVITIFTSLLLSFFFFFSLRRVKMIRQKQIIIKFYFLEKFNSFFFDFFFYFYFLFCKNKIKKPKQKQFNYNQIINFVILVDELVWCNITGVCVCACKLIKIIFIIELNLFYFFK